MNPGTILVLVGKAFEIYAELRAQAKASGVTDAELDAITADYNARIAAREAESQG